MAIRLLEPAVLQQAVDALGGIGKMQQALVAEISRQYGTKNRAQIEGRVRKTCGSIIKKGCVTERELQVVAFPLGIMPDRLFRDSIKAEVIKKWGP